jgi:hypothetical protein
MEIRNRFPKTASGPESSFSLTRQAQTNRYDRRILEQLVRVKNSVGKVLMSQNMGKVQYRCTKVILFPKHFNRVATSHLEDLTTGE